jgi:drug/metabolite transporter (DMT)-like permease
LADNASATMKTPLRAMLLIVAAGATGLFMQALVRIAGQEIHPFEVVFIRNFMALLLLAPVLFKQRVWMGISNFRLHFWRGLLQVAAMLMNWTGLTMIPIASVTAILFSAPVFVSLGAIIFLRESSHVRRWVAIGFGFIGMMIIVRPGFAEFNLGIGLVLGASVLFAGTRLIVKKLTKTNDALTIVATMAVITTPVSLVPALFYWTWPSLETLGLLAAIAGLGTVTHLLSTHAFRLADLTALEPLGYMRMIWAVLIGYFLFSELPPVWTYVGSAVIVISTTVLVRLESRDKSSSPVEE